MVSLYLAWRASVSRHRALRVEPRRCIPCTPKRACTRSNRPVITCQESCVEQRQRELGIVVLQLLVFESLELVDRAHLVPDGEVGVPQRVQQRAQEALLLGCRRACQTRSAGRRPSAGTACHGRSRQSRRGQPACSACGWRVRHRRRFGPCGPRTCDGWRGRRLLRRFRPRTRDGLHRADARRLRLGCHVREEECLGDPWFAERGDGSVTGGR